MARPNVLVTRSRCELPESACLILEERCNVEYGSTEPMPRNDFLKKIKGKDGLFCLITDKIDEELVQAADQLKVVGTMSVGYDHIDAKYLKSKGIKIGYTPGVLNNATADLAIALLLATSRRLFEAHSELIRGNWPSWSAMWMTGMGLSGSTVGVFGMGRIGQCILKRLNGFDVKRFVYCATKPKEHLNGAEFVSFEKLLCESDFVICAAASTPQTKLIFNKSAFNQMKDTAIFINIARGDLVDQDALMDALNNKEIKAAGLDVMTPEPLPVGHPLTKTPNLTLIPHIGSAEIQTRENMASLTATNIVNGLTGLPMPSEL